MNYEFCARTDPGRVRANNEDAVSVDTQARIAVLADGMGGYNAGEVAARMATSFVRTEMARWMAQAPQPIAHLQPFERMFYSSEGSMSTGHQSAWKMPCAPRSASTMAWSVSG